MPRSNLEEKVGCIKAPCCIITSIIMLITTSIILLSVAGHFVFSGPTPKRSQQTDVGEKTADGSAKLLVGDSLLKSALTSAITVDDLARMGKALNEVSCYPIIQSSPGEVLGYFMFYGSKIYMLFRLGFFLTFIFLNKVTNYLFFVIVILLPGI